MVCPQCEREMYSTSTVKSIKDIAYCTECKIVLKEE